jgi:hypothetical protein
MVQSRVQFGVPCMLEGIPSGRHMDAEGILATRRERGGFGAAVLARYAEARWFSSPVTERER